jgi:DNA-binding GntR family transcriptional regulator
MTDNHSQRAYRHLRKKLASGNLAPGSRISYGSIGREIGVSATPVREAAGQLASEGFVELVPRIGALVRQLSREEAVEMYEMREALESYAAAKAAERCSTRLIQEIDANLAKSRAIIKKVQQTKSRDVSLDLSRAFHAIDLDFHMLLIEASRNRQVLKVVGDSHVLTRIFEGSRARYRREIIERTQSEHEAIHSALRRRDSAEARCLMESHIRDSLQITLAEFDERLIAVQ